ncbi:MAG: hypothetical protein ABSC56_08055 [Solirubrobacteraceae bacterium]|jgi:hypothetical protein
MALEALLPGTRSRTGIVHIYEEEEASYDEARQRPDGSFLCATFGGRWTRHPRDSEGPCFEGLTLDQALIWARARAPQVQIRYGRGEYHSAGETNPTGLPVWPPADLPARLVRRRPPEQGWRERSEGDPPVEWRIELLLAPPNPDHMRTAKRWEAESIVERAAGEAGATQWDAEPLDAYLDGAGHADLPSIGLAGAYPPAFRLHLRAFAATSPQAEESARGRLAKLPPGWSVRATAYPPA